MRLKPVFANVLVFLKGLLAGGYLQTSSAIIGTDKRALLLIQPEIFNNMADFKPGFRVGITPAGAMQALAPDRTPR